ncbi:TetR/AcrR family transcriptional regulator [Streptomyces sp. HU2014]|uniref:TetR/AcrR family transcriptional regulator n=1 Tax=Streptomyces sp. HU2014 TaxID=2939414 RepID=UPI002010AE91|nr:TetR/AcrR family transcriptional regulator [Streptomyces sp. HU2014]UQI45868.1 TetR/AcrR family transcriptional regulator [Streptomyces sp. HU2014]
MATEEHQRRERGVTAEERIIGAAGSAFIDLGYDVSMAEIARRAGMGMSAIYRLYPSKNDLVTAVRLAGMSFIADRARQALEEEPDGARALERFLFACLGARAGHMLPVLGRRQAPTPGLDAVREEMHRAIDAVAERAKADGALRPEVTGADLLLLLDHLSPSLPLDHPQALLLQRRYARMVLDGLRTPAPAALPGPAPDWNLMKALWDGRRNQD